MKRRFTLRALLAALLTAALLTGGASAASLVGCWYSDVPRLSWYAQYVWQMSGMGLMSGTTETTFSPDEPMTRAMLEQCLYSMECRPTVTRTTEFSDLTQDWYRDAVSWAVQNGITEGTTETTFSPDAAVTREALAQFLYAAAGRPYTVGLLEEDFADGADVSLWAYTAMVWAVQEGIISGSDEGGSLPCLHPQQQASRAEAAAMLTHFYEVNYGDLPEVRQPDVRDGEFETADVDTSAIPEGVEVPVLMYHECSDDVWGLEYLFVSPASMRQQLLYLKENGYDTIFFSDLDHLQDYDKPIILTFDDGYNGNYDELYPLLKEFNMKATIFVVADHIGDTNRLTAAQIKEMSDSGLVSIQSHTSSHHLLANLSEQHQGDELRDSRITLAAITGKLPYVLAYPQSCYDKTTLELADTYYEFAVLAKGGTWTSSTHGLLRIPRSLVGRDTTMAGFIKIVS